jgi:hypothetical protein
MSGPIPVIHDEAVFNSYPEETLAVLDNREYFWFCKALGFGEPFEMQNGGDLS